MEPLNITHPNSKDPVPSILSDEGRLRFNNMCALPIFTAKCQGHEGGKVDWLQSPVTKYFSHNPV